MCMAKIKNKAHLIKEKNRKNLKKNNAKLRIVLRKNEYPTDRCPYKDTGQDSKERNKLIVDS